MKKANVSGELRKFLGNVRSRTEERWAQVGKFLIAEKFNCAVIFEGYEWMTFHVPGGSYTPDYVYILENGSVVFVEIKGSGRQKNYRDARSKLRSAAAVNPWFIFCEARADRAYALEIITKDDFAVNLGISAFADTKLVQPPEG